jgi:site-specific DNA-methyltransferase (adenine-specific)
MKSIQHYINKIICGDSLTVMREMPSECLDLVVTSPPYNLKNSTGNGMKAGTKSGKWSGAALQNGLRQDLLLNPL